MVLAQLYVPASMIFRNERVIREGTAFKFKTAPIDPNDPFGENMLPFLLMKMPLRSKTRKSGIMRRACICNLTTDSAGFALINVSIKNDSLRDRKIISRQY